MKTTKLAAPCKKKVLLVDDHPLLREGLARLINRQPDLAVCGEASTASEALAAVAKHKPDLALLDISLPGTDGFALTKELLARRATLPVLIFSMHDEAVYAERALHAGARGYVMKREPTETCLQAIRQVLAGKIAVSHAVTAQLAHKITTRGSRSTVQLLTDRELEIFHLLGAGRNRHEIAADLHVSTKTVEAHRANICKKLNLHGAAELLRQATVFVHTESRPPAG